LAERYRYSRILEIFYFITRHERVFPSRVFPVLSESGIPKSGGL
jgi:hypothetical protein